MKTTAYVFLLNIHLNYAPKKPAHCTLSCCFDDFVCLHGEHLHVYYVLLLIADVCELEPETGPCLAYKPRYFYNATSHECERFVYGGCRGNGNRFRTKSRCQNTCQSECQVKIC